MSSDSDGTLTLGGLVTTDGTKGFVVVAHSIANSLEGYTNTHVNTFVYNKRDRQFLGKVARMPRTWKGGEGYFIGADAAFIAYPGLYTSSDCSLTWERENGVIFCLDLDIDEQIETVVPLAIRGKGGTIYTVIGSQSPIMGTEVWFSGGVSGAVEGNTISGGRVLTKDTGVGVYSYVYDFTGGALTAFGDSGSPVYTVPDENGNVRIIGSVYGFHTIAGKKRTNFHSWDDVTKALDLKPIR